MPAAAETATQTADEREMFTLRQRIALWALSTLGYLAVRLIGPTLRFEVSREEAAPPDEHGQRLIYVFWHRCVFPGTYFYRNRGIAVMTSSSFDGEYIARIIEACGYKAVRGSSTRGAVRALLGMHAELEEGRSVAFTIDGPRGPAYVAKSGPVLLARNTGAPIFPFYIAVKRAWVLRSWDRFVIPKPFSRAVLRLGNLIHVPDNINAEQAESYHWQMQQALDRVTQWAEKCV